jgi:hypothetical protein
VFYCVKACQFSEDEATVKHPTKKERMRLTCSESGLNPGHSNCLLTC